MVIKGGKDGGRGGSGGERSSARDQWCLGDLHLEAATGFLMGVLETNWVRNANTAAGGLRVESLQ